MHRSLKFQRKPAACNAGPSPTRGPVRPAPSTHTHATPAPTPSHIHAPTHTLTHTLTLMSVHTHPYTHRYTYTNTSTHTQTLTLEEPHIHTHTQSILTYTRAYTLLCARGTAIPQALGCENCDILKSPAALRAAHQWHPSMGTDGAVCLSPPGTLALQLSTPGHRDRPGTSLSQAFLLGSERLSRNKGPLSVPATRL